MEKLKKRWNITSNFQLIVVFVVFAITGSASAYLFKPLTNAIGITKEMFGFWYLPIRLVAIFPIYQVLLVLIGAIFGQFNFFWWFEKKMLKATVFGFLSKAKKLSTKVSEI